MKNIVQQINAMTINIRAYVGITNSSEMYVRQKLNSIKKDTVFFHMDNMLTRLQDMVGKVQDDIKDDTCACKPMICQWPAACHTTLHSYGAPEICLMVSTLGQPFCHRNTCRLKELFVITFYTPDTSILHPCEFLK